MARPIFLAAPESGRGATGLIDRLLVELEATTSGAISASKVFNPHLSIGDVGIDVKGEAYFTGALTALNEAKVVLAVLDGPQVDEQVAFLVGYAFAAGKPVVGYRSDLRGASSLVAGALVETTRDLRELVAALRRHLPA